MKGRGTFIVILTLIIVVAVLWTPLNDYITHIMYPLEYEEFILKYANEHELDPYLVAALIKAESNFVPDAQSHKDARGLMQLVDGTAQGVAAELKIDYSFDMLTNPELNIRIGTYYLAHLMDMYNGDVRLALCAYNAGFGNVDKWLDNPKYTFEGNLHTIPFPETQKYLDNTLLYTEKYRKLYPDFDK